MTSPYIEKLASILYNPDGEAGYGWGDAEAKAQEILTAMREPSDEMIAAGEAAGDEGVGDIPSSYQIRKAFSAMIDVALVTTPTELTPAQKAHAEQVARVDRGEPGMYYIDEGQTGSGGIGD
jgi:hypothetical protein